MTDPGVEAVQTACRQLGVEPGHIDPIRLGENSIYRLAGQVIARLTREGQQPTARREVMVARWLGAEGLPAVRPLDVDQPVSVDGRAVTLWHEIPIRRGARPGEIAGAIRRLHDLPIPEDLGLTELAPFVRIADRVEAATGLSGKDRSWLLGRLDDLTGRYRSASPSRLCVVHGDAWAGNVVVAEDDEVTLLDLERCSVGPPEWDLVSTAIKLTSVASITEAEYAEFCTRYGADVTQWEGFELFRDIRELRMCTYVVQLAAENPAAKVEAEHRIRCLQGLSGPRPWTWTAF